MHAQSIAQEATGQQTLEHAHALNSDIIKTIHKNYVRGVQQMQKHAPKFKGRNTTETAQNIWNFLKKEINYKRDPDHAQLIKLPGRLAADQTGDCKSYSLFAASVLGALGKPVKFRYTSYTSDNTPSHVYTVTKDENGKEVIIDGVYHTFNKQKPYTHKIDKKMKVYTLSGINGPGSINGVTWEQIADKIKAVGINAAHIFYFALLLPVRGAFRLLVRNNVFGLASKLWAAQYYKKKSDQILNLWYGMGGRRANLNVDILTGYRKKPIWSKTQKISGLGINGEPITISVVLASAGAAMAAFNEFTKEGKEALNNLKSSAENAGIPVDDILSEGQNIIDTTTGGGTTSGSGSTSGGTTNNTQTTYPVTLKYSSAFTPGVNLFMYGTSGGKAPAGQTITIKAEGPNNTGAVFSGTVEGQGKNLTFKQPVGGATIYIKGEPKATTGGGGSTTAETAAIGLPLIAALAAGAYFLTKK